MNATDTITSWRLHDLGRAPVVGPRSLGRRAADLVARDLTNSEWTTDPQLFR